MLDPVKVKRQEIKMLNRKLLEISGVTKVESFNSVQFLIGDGMWNPEDQGSEFTYQKFKLRAGISGY